MALIISNVLNLYVPLTIEAVRDRSFLNFPEVAKGNPGKILIRYSLPATEDFTLVESIASTQPKIILIKYSLPAIEDFTLVESGCDAITRLMLIGYPSPATEDFYIPESTISSVGAVPASADKGNPITFTVSTDGVIPAKESDTITPNKDYCFVGTSSHSQTSAYTILSGSSANTNGINAITVIPNGLTNNVTIYFRRTKATTWYDDDLTDACLIFYFIPSTLITQLNYETASATYQMPIQSAGAMPSNINSLMIYHRSTVSAAMKVRYIPNLTDCPENTLTVTNNWTANELNGTDLCSIDIVTDANGTTITAKGLNGAARQSGTFANIPNIWDNSRTNRRDLFIAHYHNLTGAAQTEKLADVSIDTHRSVASEIVRLTFTDGTAELGRDYSVTGITYSVDSGANWLAVNSAKDIEIIGGTTSSLVKVTTISNPVYFGNRTFTVNTYPISGEMICPFYKTTTLTINETIPISTYGKGYWGGGYTTSYKNTVDGINFTTEAAFSLGITLVTARGFLGTGNSTTKGYWIGGTTGSASGEIDGINFATEAAINPGATMKTPKLSAGSISSAIKVYLGGGGNPAVLSAIECFDYNLENTANLTAVLAVARSASAGVQSSAKGYFLGGASASYYAEIDGINFTQETYINPAGALSLVRNLGATMSSPTKGYIAAGSTTSGVYINNINAFTFATETAVSMSITTSVNKTDCSGTGYSLRGYLSSGTTGSSPGLGVIERIDYTTETIKVLSAVLPTARDMANAVANTNQSAMIYLGKGYVSGGLYGGSNTANIEGLDFTVETTMATIAVLATARRALTGVYSPTYGFSIGGYTTVSVTEIDGMQFSTEAANNPATALSPAKCRMAGFQSTTSGYVGGGSTDLTISLTAIDKLLFSGPTRSTLSAVISVARQTPAGVQSATNGYFTGGFHSTTEYSEIDGLLFSGETATNPAAVLSIARYAPTGTSSTTKGYIGGGSVLSAPPYYDTIDALTFSSETVAALTSTLSVGRRIAVPENSYTKGYYVGGAGAGGTTGVIDALNFTTETAGSISAVMNNARDNPAAGWSNVVVLVDYGKAYIAGGISGGSYLSSILRFVFLSETIVSQSETLPRSKHSMGSVQSSSYGYFAGGRFQVTTVNDIMRYQFSNESTGDITTTLSEVKQNMGTASSSIKGYFAGGTYSVNISNIDGINFFNDSYSIITADLTIARWGPNGVASSSKAYFGGGNTGYASWDIDGVVFETDTSIDPSATLSVKRPFTGSSSSSTKGYWSGGGTSPQYMYTTMDAITFSNETAAALGSSLGTSVFQPANGGSTIRGYLFGGSGNNQLDIIQAVDYGTEVSLTIGATLPAVRGVAEAVSKQNNVADVVFTGRNYVAGGNTGSYSSSIESMDFTSEFVLTFSMTLNLARSYLASAESLLKGYFAGGFYAISSDEIDGLVFSTNTSTNPSAVLSAIKQGPIGVASTTAAYFGGGDNVMMVTAIDKLLFSNETSSTLSAVLTLGRCMGVAGNSPTKGFFIGGDAGIFGGGKSTEIDGLNFATEAAINPSTTLPTARYAMGSLSSQQKAYCGGGQDDSSTAIMKFDFETYATANATATLSAGRYGAAGSSSYTKGFFSGGFSGISATTEIDGITFATDASYNPAITLNAAKYGAAGVEDRLASSYSTDSGNGYFYGGFSQPAGNIYYNTINKISFTTDFNAEIATTLVRGRYACAGVKSSTKGYWAQGEGNSGTAPSQDGLDIEGIQFSDDSAINPAAVLSVTRKFGGSGQSTTKGYWAGGYGGWPSEAYKNTIDGFTFSNEACAAIGATLIVAAGGHASMSISTKTYLAGGNDGTQQSNYYSSIFELLFATEALTQSSFALTAVKNGAGGVNTETKGYVGGGYSLNNGYFTVIDAINFTTSSCAALSSVLSQKRQVGALSSKIKGYFAGGWTGTTDVDYIDGVLFPAEVAINYSSALSTGRRLPSGVSNSI